MSSALDATIISLYSSLAFASRVAMNAEPTYAKSAPIARAARTERPFAIAPESASGPSNQARISWTSANGESRPACPPAPAATGISPSAPFSIALRANASLMTSCSTTPP